MPDESCRKCGGKLIAYSNCNRCRKVIQNICCSCGFLTFIQHHEQCFFDKVTSFQINDAIGA